MESRFFCGTSIADGNGYATTERPSNPGQYEYAQTFYRVPLRDFIEFNDRLPLTDLFHDAEAPLLSYYHQNKLKAKRERELLFYVIQNGRLQRQFGAYLTHFSEPLAAIVFGRAFSGSANHRTVAFSTRTGEQMSLMKRRVGQRDFSDQVRANYGHRCCFPNCEIVEGYLLFAHRSMVRL